MALSMKIEIMGQEVVTMNGVIPWQQGMTVRQAQEVLYQKCETI